MKNAEMLFDAIGEISEEFILEAEKKPSHRRLGMGKRLLAACLALCVLVLPVSAEIRDGYISNLLAPFYGGTRTEIVENIGKPVGASVTVGDYTLTADAVIGDRYNIAIVYSLTHVDGEVLPEGLRFDIWEGGIGGGSGGGSLSHDRSKNGKTMYITEQWTSTNRLFGIRRNVTRRFRDLVIWEKGKEDIPVQEGLWELKFMVRYPDTTKQVQAKGVTVMGADGTEYSIRKLLLSPVGIHIDMLGTPMRDNDHFEEMYLGLKVQLLLQDGTYVDIENANFGGGGKLEGGKFKWRYGAMFAVPVDLKEVQAVVVCGTEIPVE